MTKYQEELIQKAIEYIESHTSFVGVDDTLIIDGIECDGYFLAEELKCLLAEESSTLEQIPAHRAIQLRLPLIYK